MGSLLIRNARVLDPCRGLDATGDILVDDGLIVEVRIGAGGEAPRAERVLDASGLVATPGFIDLHCHLREPGEEHKETIATGTRAAARGGFTTVCCMPNTQPPMDNVSVVGLVLRKAREEGVVRVLPIGCVTWGREGKELVEMGEMAEAGVVGFSDDGGPVCDAVLMRSALSLTLTSGVPIMNHCEELTISAGGSMNEGWVATRLGLKGIPSAAEEAMVGRDIALSRLTGGRLHICHVSTPGSAELIRMAKAEGVAVTAEVTPHHLTLTEEWVMGHRGGTPLSEAVGTAAYDTDAKVAPPLRTRAEADALVEALREGVIDAVATDHAPHDFTSKAVPFEDAASGLSVFETAFGSLMGLVHKGQLELARLVACLTCNPARILGERYQGLGTLEPGTPADVVLFDPDREWTVNTGQFISKGKNSPLDDVTLKGKVMATIAGGRVVYQDDSLEYQE